MLSQQKLVSFFSPAIAWDFSHRMENFDYSLLIVDQDSGHKFWFEKLLLFFDQKLY